MKPIHQQISVLFTAQALALTSNVTFIAVNGLAGAQLTDNASFATLPITFQVLAAALATFPASLFMQKFGRRAGFSLGAACGMVGALLAAWGVMTGSMALLCAGSFIAGCYNANKAPTMPHAAPSENPALRPYFCINKDAGYVASAAANT